MKKRLSIVLALVLIVTMFCGCGSKDTEMLVPDTTNTENNDEVKSAVNDNKNDYSSLFSDPASEAQAKVSDKKEEPTSTPTPVPTAKVEPASTTVITDISSLGKNKKVWSFDTWGIFDDVDYFGAENFEKDLNAGKNLKGKTVMFEAVDVRPDLVLGYDIWGGEHLNFISSNKEMSKVKVGDIIVATVESIDSLEWGDYTSWIIYMDMFATPSKTDNSSDYDDYDWSWLYDDPTPIPTEEPTNYTYESNQYFDVVDSYTYKNGKYTYIIDKIIGKQNNKHIDLTMLIYDKNGDVVDKCTPDVIVNNGQYNFITYYIEADDYDHHSISYTASSSWHGGDPDSVKMVKYSKKNSKVLITFEQTGEIGSFAEFKLLFFKGDELVYSGSWYFDVYVKQLNGVGSVDVAELSISKDFDTIEYYYGP